MKKETHFMASVGLHAAADCIKRGISDLTEIGVRSAACHIRNAQIELAKVADELTLAASREVPYIYTMPRAPMDWHKDFGNALWWDEDDAGSPPYSGNPYDDDFPFVMSHSGLWWTPLPPVNLWGKK